MALASLGGGSGQQTSSLSRRGSSGWSLARVGLGKCHSHRAHPPCLPTPRGWVTPGVTRAFTLASEPTVSGLDHQAGSDLTDMCTLQLGMLYQLLARAGNNYGSMRCTVYARNFTAVGPGQVKLLRVAQFPVAPGQGEDASPQQGTLLLHTEQSWALQGGSAAVDPSAMIEDCLRHREVVALPSSSSLVFPLVDCAVLVGLLVVELETERERDAVGGVQAGAAATAAAVPQLTALCAAEADSRGAGPGQGGAGSGPADTSLQLHGRPRRSLTEEELQCLRLSVPLLAKACGMDARASWQLAQSSLGTAAARGILRDVQRPLSTLNTFSAMLIPRLKDGDPDKDMAKGILLQGKRLQDLMWQLEDALHGAPGASHGLGAVPADMPLAGPGGVHPHPHLLSVAAPPFRSPTALPRDPSPAVQELLQLPQPRRAALPPGSQQDQPQQPPQAATSSTSTSSHDIPDLRSASAVSAAAASAGDGAGPAPVHPGQVTFVERDPPVASAPLGSGGLGAFTIRQPPPAVGTGRPAPHSSPAALDPRPGGRGYLSGQAVPAAGPGAATATIDVEMDSCESRQGEAGPGPGSVSAARLPERRAGGGGGPRSGTGGSTWAVSSGGHAAALTVSTNLASALTGVLTAACRLAAVSGIGMIVNSPLSAVLPKRGGAGGGGKSKGSPAAGSAPGPPGISGQQQGGAAGPAAADRDSPSDPRGLAAKPHLIPRPARPLFVGVRSALVQKVVGYMLDIALQCTPRGGQVCVSARQDGAGVQVQVLHSGRMDLQRLHLRSRSMAAVRSGVGSHAAGPGLGAGATPATATVAAPGAASRELALAHCGTDGKAVGGGGAAAAAVAVAGGARPSAGLLGDHGVPAVGGGRGGGGGLQAGSGSGVLSVEMAQELAQQAGGYLTVSYPFNMVNAQSGNLDVGTSVEIWLPGPCTAC